MARWERWTASRESMIAMPAHLHVLFHRDHPEATGLPSVFCPLRLTIRQSADPNVTRRPYRRSRRRRIGNQALARRPSPQATGILRPAGGCQHRRTQPKRSRHSQHAGHSRGPAPKASSSGCSGSFVFCNSNIRRMSPPISIHHLLSSVTFAVPRLRLGTYTQVKWLDLRVARRTCLALLLTGGCSFRQWALPVDPAAWSCSVQLRLRRSLFRAFLRWWTSRCEHGCNWRNVRCWGLERRRGRWGSRWCRWNGRSSRQRRDR